MLYIVYFLILNNEVLITMATMLPIALMTAVLCVSAGADDSSGMLETDTMDAAGGNGGFTH